MISKITIHFVWLLKSGLKWTLIIKSLRKRYDMNFVVWKNSNSFQHFFCQFTTNYPKKIPLKTGIFLSIPCSFYHSYPLHVRITHDQMWRLKKFFFTCADIYITNIYFKICMNGLAILSANHRHLQCTRLQLPYPKSHYKYMDRNTFYILCCT